MSRRRRMSPPMKRPPPAEPMGANASDLRQTNGARPSLSAMGTQPEGQPPMADTTNPGHGTTRSCGRTAPPTTRCRCGSGWRASPTRDMKPTATPTSSAAQLAWILGKPPDGDRPFKRVDRTTMRDAIALTIKHGWLAEGSCTECLIVPGHAITGGLGDPDKPCPVHDRRHAAKRRAQLTLVAE